MRRRPRSCTYPPRAPRITAAHRQRRFIPPPRRYDPHDVRTGPAPIALTIALITDRRTCAATVQQSGVMADIVADSKPLWNGEDIFHSLVAYQLSGAMPPFACVAFGWEAWSGAAGRA